MMARWREHLRNMKPIPMFSWTLNNRLVFHGGPVARRWARQADLMSRIDRRSWTVPYCLWKMFKDLDKKEEAEQCLVLYKEVREKWRSSQQYLEVHRIPPHVYEVEIAALPQGENT